MNPPPLPGQNHPIAPKKKSGCIMAVLILAILAVVALISLIGLAALGAKSKATSSGTRASLTPERTVEIARPTAAPPSDTSMDRGADGPREIEKTVREGIPFPHFNSIPEMIEELGDYSSDNGTFEIIARKPLHIRLSRLVDPSESAQSVKDQNEQTLLYGILRAFIHTQTDEITVTAFPIEQTDSKRRSLRDMAVTLRVHRVDVLALISQVQPTKKFDDLLVVKDLGGFESYEPSEVYQRIYNDGNGVKPPGRKRFLAELAKLARSR
ncbi:hypothetical protein KBB96_17105 [Luteolibacter ambystomatis]|uniref:Uncharacterized protein n=1 Tax=Luteolibacter ambystomatis TaxID=2824561 RepID=A0A975G757_9BACT|nr:hypothetical protein [Luteolibacter ambystomatis]QUE50569.1 hypothetical protein KBB96_17105 [Luteolibacter ambystomatis]